MYVDGLAASAASLIAMAGQVVYMPKNAMMMVHNPIDWEWGNAQAHRKMADDLDKIRESMVVAYLDKAGDKLTEARLIEMLDAETWLTAQECYDCGLCDQLLAEKQVAACVHEDVLARYENVPESLHKLAQTAGLDPSELLRRSQIIEDARANSARIDRILKGVESS